MEVVVVVVAVAAVVVVAVVVVVIIVVVVVVEVGLVVVAVVVIVVVVVVVVIVVVFIQLSHSTTYSHAPYRWAASHLLYKYYTGFLIYVLMSNMRAICFCVQAVITVLILVYLIIFYRSNIPQ